MLSRFASRRSSRIIKNGKLFFDLRKSQDRDKMAEFYAPGMMRAHAIYMPKSIIVHPWKNMKMKKDMLMMTHESNWNWNKDI